MYKLEKREKELPPEDYKSSLAVAEELMDQGRAADEWYDGSGDLYKEGSEVIEALVEELIAANEKIHALTGE